MIRFTNVSKLYSGFIPALSDVTVEIPDGDFVFLIGPSGAGKTTLLRLLIRDLVPSEGDIYIDELHINRMPASKIHILRRSVGTVFQDFRLLLDRTVFENVALTLEVLGKKEHAIKRDVMSILSLVGLTDKHNQFPAQLSAGELQRTGIARAVIAGPKILLADEPTGNLDPETSEEIIDILSEVNKMGTTVIMATHNERIVNEKKKRTIALSRGSIVSDEQKGRYHTGLKTGHKKT